MIQSSDIGWWPLADNGTESYTDASKWCNQCQCFIAFDQPHICYTMTPPLQGWQCPICHRIYSPTVQSCDCSVVRWQWY